MKFLLDECLPGEQASELAKRGHDCTKVVEEMPGARDAEILAHSKRTGRILLSEDRDFGILVFRDGHPALGIGAIYFKRFDCTYREAIARVADQIEAVGETVVGHFTVIEPGQTRLRKLPPID